MEKQKVKKEVKFVQNLNTFTFTIKDQYLFINVVTSTNQLYQSRFCNDSLQQDVKLVFPTIEELYQFFQAISKEKTEKKEQSNEKDEQKQELQDSISFNQKGQINIKMSIKIKNKQINKNISLHLQPQSLDKIIQNIKNQANLQLQNKKAIILQLEEAVQKLQNNLELLKESNQTIKEKHELLKQKEYKKHLLIQQQRNKYKQLALINKNMKQYIQKITNLPYQLNEKQQQSLQQTKFSKHNQFIKGGEIQDVPEVEQEQELFQSIYTVSPKYKKYFKKMDDDDQYVKFESAQKKEEIYKVFNFVPYKNNQWNEFYNYYHVIKRRNSQGWCQVVSNKPLQYNKKTILRFKVLKKDVNNKISLAIGLITEDRLQSASSFGQPQSISYVFDQYTEKKPNFGFITQGASKSNSVNCISAFGKKIGDVLTIQVDLQQMLVVWKINDQQIRKTDLNQVKAFAREQQNKGAEAIYKQKVKIYGFLQFGYQQTQIAVKYTN